MKIKIVDVELSSATDKKGKPYQIVEVSYKNLTFQGKMESRKIMPFGATAETNKLLAKAQKGEVYDIEVVKSAAGYNDWVSATKVEEGDVSPAPAPRAAAQSTSVSASPAPAIKSTYETPEERAKKQVYIVRQSSITAALAFHKMIMDNDSEVGFGGISSVLDVAKEFENYVFGIETSAKPPAVSLADMEDDIPT